MDSVTRCPTCTASAEKSVAQIIGEVTSDICDNYCKMPEQYEDHDEMLDAVCNDCPLNKLG